MFLQNANQRWSSAGEGRNSTHSTTYGGGVVGAIPSAVGRRPRPQAPCPGVQQDRRPHVELTIYWSSKNKENVLALLDTRAECTLINGKPNYLQDPVLWRMHIGLNKYL